MKVIDFEKRGNVVRFYLGENNCKDYWGDDWADRPYESNAGSVYGEYIINSIDFAFPFDYLVLEPCDGEYNSPWCKEDFKKRKTPCIVIVPNAVWQEDGYSWRDDNYRLWVGCQNSLKIYFGDNDEDVNKSIVEFGGVKL